MAQTDGAPHDACRSDDLAEAITTLVSHLIDAASERPEIASALRTLGQMLVEIAPATSATVGADEREGAAEDEVPAVPTTRKVLSIGGTRMVLEVPDHGPADAKETPAGPVESHARTVTRREAPLTPVELVVERCRVKSDACDWAIERRSRLAEGADFDVSIKPHDHELRRRIEPLEGCRAWSLDPYANLPDDGALADAAGCYRALADALSFTERIRRDDDLFDHYGERAYEILAASSSALRAALFACDVAHDADQQAAFERLRRYVHDDQIYVRRHMRVSDPAPPDSWTALQDEIERREREIADGEQRDKERRNLLGKLDYETKRWADDGGEIERVRKIDETLPRLAEIGVRMSDPGIRDALLRIADDIPEEHDASEFLIEALRHADETLARRQSDPGTRSTADAAESDEVVRVRRLLQGRAVVLIGGECRERSRQALESGLGLARLEWITTRPHESTSRFTAAIRRDDVALVLLAIRWSSHSFGDVKKICDEAGKTFVRLPRGYGVNQVAHEILQQASQELSSQEPSSEP